MSSPSAGLSASGPSHGAATVVVVRPPADPPVSPPPPPGRAETLFSWCCECVQSVGKLGSPEFSRVRGQEVMSFLESSDDGDGFEAGLNGLK